MQSANQLYKESKSTLSFKEWLNSKQKDGVLENHERMFNASGTTSNGTTTKKAKKSMGMLNMIGIVSLGLLVYGLTRTSDA
jgi:hypothetical protein